MTGRAPPAGEVDPAHAPGAAGSSSSEHPRSGAPFAGASGDLNLSALARLTGGAQTSGAQSLADIAGVKVSFSEVGRAGVILSRAEPRAGAHRFHAPFPNVQLDSEKVASSGPEALLR